jgi:hypothetical protein
VLSVQEESGANNFDAVFNLRDGPPPAQFVEPGPNGRFPLPSGVFTRLLRDKQKVNDLHAWNVSVQRQLTNTLSAELAYVGNRSTRAFIGNGPAANYNDPTLVGFGTLNSNQRRPFFNGGIQGYPQGYQGDPGTFGAPFGWTQGIDYFCNCGKTSYQALQAKITRQFANGWSLLAHYTFQKAKNNTGSYFFIDPDLNYGPANFIRTHVFVLSGVAELPFGRGKRWASDASGFKQALLGGWQANANVTIQSGLPFSVCYRDSGADRDTGPCRADVIGDPDVGRGDGISSPYFNVTPIGSSGSAFGRPAAGTFGNQPRNDFRGPSWWNVDASLFKRFSLWGDSNLELRFEVQNLFNHINLNNPDSEVGVPGNNNPNAGFITSMAPNALPRFLQLGIRFQF